MLSAETGQEQNKVLNCITTEEVIEKLTVVMAERLVLVPELKEVTVGEAAGKTKMVANKQDEGGGRKDGSGVQRADKFRDGMMLVTGSENFTEEGVMQEIGSRL